MVKKSKILGDELVLTAKAIRRGEKLERTLTKLAALQEPRSPAEVLLKAVQKGLEQLRKDEAPAAGDKAVKENGAKKAAESPDPAPQKKQPRPKAPRNAKKPAVTTTPTETA